MTAAALVCGSCGTELPSISKFCNECGAAVATATTPAEYKQVTVLFADVVHSMDIAATVGPERLREIMADLADRCAAVVGRYGGTVDKFTGDGIMAVFGAPTALEDHAIRACLAALGVQEEAKRLAVDVQERDGVDFQLRVGLNSGQVIAGEIGSGPFGYTDSRSDVLDTYFNKSGINEACQEHVARSVRCQARQLRFRGRKIRCVRAAAGYVSFGVVAAAKSAADIVWGTAP
jgi:hypothetical protein